MLATGFKPGKILIVLHGAIGDVTRALPLARLLRRRFPEAALSWSVEPAAAPLLELDGSIDDIIVFDRSRGIPVFLRFLRTIRSRRFDLVLDLQRHFKSGVISRFSGAQYRLGFHPTDSKEFNWLFNNFHIPAKGELVPKILHYLEFAEYLGAPTEPIEWDFHINAEDRRRAASLLGDGGNPAVLFIGSRWESKQWFPAQIAATASAIRTRHNLPVVFLGSLVDRQLAEQAELLTTGAIVNLTGRTSLREAVAIVSLARFCVGPDTGLMHIAAALGKPVVSLWGATDPGRNGPYGFGDLMIQGRADCAPCRKRHCSIGRLCMQSITTEAILTMVDRALARGTASRAVPGAAGGALR